MSNSVSSGKLKEYVLYRPEWQEDSTVTTCSGCEAGFSWTRRRHHCRMCGNIFCADCTANKLRMPPEYGYEDPQRVCMPCFSNGARYQERRQGDDKELLLARFYLRDSAFYTLTNKRMVIGHREAPGKSYFHLEHKKSQAHIWLMFLDGSRAPAPIHTPTSRKVFEHICYNIKHPFIYPLLEVDFMDDKNRVVFFQEHSKLGSVKDQIFHNAKPNSEYDHKYGRRPGRALPTKTIQRCGRHVLEALLFLKSLNFPYPHLHTGNMIVDANSKCCITGLENTLLGLEPFYKLSGKLSPEVECFGNVVWEMAFGQSRTLTPAEVLDGTPSTIPETCDSDVRNVLVYIFNPSDPNRRLKIQDILKLPFFQAVQLSEEMPVKPQLIPKAVNYIKVVRQATREMLVKLHSATVDQARSTRAASNRKQKEEARAAKMAMRQRMRDPLVTSGQVGGDKQRNKGLLPGERALRAAKSGDRRTGSRTSSGSSASLTASDSSTNTKKSTPSSSSSPSPSSTSSSSSSSTTTTAAASSSASAGGEKPRRKKKKKPIAATKNSDQLAASAPAAPAPPPPPPPAAPKLSAPLAKSLPPPQSGRSALLDSIRAGKRLRKVEKPN
mmetsp:Transcript_43121/g.108905  ORF Transcript_43121/g.108905 Transcript_43121/m.108905 type:complete len:609 (+) Transcript_43121:167-1993(+)|eukprot:CAMPEP_0177634036 /NCGR_PEP_ID=MMETSP0447-20121125/3158_1 /TAXON_ID=0 /ORGANISM="Stygamoeba regulata, Strain BSH-02190019" /LENGTH=608 /DNA_ID=CAMNT_0019135739 /DNA_START=166 /DNA_END=1992 /DNA_ORIENTATION=-